ncbi:hypothetical protein [Pedobacter sp. MW01-1-1]|uniref:hypothetical protein n=1 Tax=Pedobacter sp. MW01-1-1 TaxID=3383027 RepID=UPI003FEF4D23
MKKIFIGILFFSLIFTLAAQVGYSQISVDGHLKDWGDSTQFKYDKENKLWYHFKKDQHFLYMGIKKNENARKFSSGGIEIYFSPSKIDTTSSFCLKFGNCFTEPETKKVLCANHDYIMIENYKGVKRNLLPKYNEEGILADWFITNIDNPPRMGTGSPNQIAIDPNIFSCEIQIPLTVFKEMKSNRIHFGICLPSSDKKKLGMQNPIVQMVGQFNSPSALNFYDLMLFSEFYGDIDLTQL